MLEESKKITREIRTCESGDALCKKDYCGELERASFCLYAQSEKDALLQFVTEKFPIQSVEENQVLRFVLEILKPEINNCDCF